MLCYCEHAKRTTHLFRIWLDSGVRFMILLRAELHAEEFKKLTTKQRSIRQVAKFFWVVAMFAPCSATPNGCYQSFGRTAPSKGSVSASLSAPPF